jgi:hypothetical protein
MMIFGFGCAIIIVSIVIYEIIDFFVEEIKKH